MATNVTQSSPTVSSPSNPAIPQTRWYVKLLTSANWVGLGLAGTGGLHALPGMSASARLQSPITLWVATLLWWVVTCLYAASAFGLWGFPRMQKYWRALSQCAAVSSLMLLVGFKQWTAWPLFLIDLAVLFSNPVGLSAKSVRPNSFFRAIVRLGALASLLYASLVILLHPWYQNWGAHEFEISRTMIGDPKPGDRLHLINHVVTVNAPPTKVWSWLIQTGQDRAGFYSYDGPERLFGTGIHNVYEIRPEWQTRRAGDFLPSCPPGWLGGRVPSLTGWKIGKVIPNSLLYVELWGPLWLDPQPDGTTRLGIRTDVGSLPLLAAPAELFLFEPIHFLMEQRMLRTIKELAEDNANHA